MLIKAGVVTDSIDPALWYACGVFESLYKMHGMTLVVTSMRDGDHMLTSKHYVGLAVDLRTRDIPTSTLSLIINEAHGLLYHLGYDIVLELDHLHVEWDGKVPARDQWILVHA